jgi:cytoskeletal protein CcmA (bactofilin family)
MLFNKKTHDELPPERSDLQTAEVSVVKPSLALAPKTRPEGTATRSVIDPWLRITGNLEGEAELQIDGEICGDIRCTKLVISKGATVNGNVTAEEVIIRGTVIGIVRGNRVFLQEGAYVQNEISYKRLCIEEEAHFEGIVRMSENPIEELRKVAAEMKAAPKRLSARVDAATNTAEAADFDDDGEDEGALSAAVDNGRAVQAPLTDSEFKRLKGQLRSNRPA